MLLAGYCHIKSILGTVSLDWSLCQSRVLLTTAILIFSPLGPHGQNIGNAQITEEKIEIQELNNNNNNNNNSNNSKI